MKKKKQFVVCVSNEGNEASLELHKSYRLLPDRAGSRYGLIRVIDEFGEDYLYPKEHFHPEGLIDPIET